MKKFECFECEYCDKLYKEKTECEAHEKQHQLNNEAQKMLDNGCTLKEINDNLNLWENNKFPDYMHNLTKNSKLKITSESTKLVGFDTYMPYLLFYSVIDEEQRPFNRNDNRCIRDCFRFLPNHYALKRTLKQ